MIAVLVILATIGAVAVPAYLNLRRDAEHAQIQDAWGKFKTGVQAAKAACMARRSGSGPTFDLPGYADGNVDFSSDCLITGTNNAAPDARSSTNNTRCEEIWQTINGRHTRFARNWPFTDGDWLASEWIGMCVYYLARPLSANEGGERRRRQPSGDVERADARTR